jgi:hypothetical protein
VPTANPLKTDPTRTGALRNRLDADLRRRLNTLRRALFDLIVASDVFGLSAPASSFAPIQQWRFFTAAEKLTAFRQWLDFAATRVFFPGERWWEKYVIEAYEKGAARSLEEIRRPRGGPVERAATVRQFLDGLGSPPAPGVPILNAASRDVAGKFITERAAALAARLDGEIGGLSALTVQTIGRAVTDGLDRGFTARQIARDIELATEVSRKRALLIAQTEVVRIHAEGQLDGMEKLGVVEVGAVVEWSTATGACVLCAPLKGVLFKMNEARGLIPRHPRCRCAWAAANLASREPGQKAERRQVERALRASVKGEGESRWPGASLDVQPRGAPASTMPAGVRTVTKREPATTELPDGRKVKWVPDPIANPRANVTILIDPRKMDADWAKDRNFYIPPGGGGAEIGGRRSGFEEFLRKGTPVQAPKVELGADGLPTFVNGRHRFSVVRDLGATEVAVTIPRSQVAEFLRRYGPDKRSGARLGRPVHNTYLVVPPEVSAALLLFSEALNRRG